MVKKFLKLVTVFTLLLGCYQGYVRTFAVLVGRLTAARKVDDVGFTVRDSRSKKEAIVRAREAFGPDHWTAREDLQLRYYNSDRGLWLYSQREERVLEEDGVKYDGRRLKLRPAAIIWRDRDGKSTKTVTADEAVIDFNQPLTFNIRPDAEPLVVKYARLERDVVIRDDRGTVLDRRDDLVIGPLTWVEFDDSSLQVRSDSRVLIVDRDTTITGDGLLIQLRPKAEAAAGAPRAAGFEGAQNARLDRNVEVAFSDIGKTRILPGAPAADPSRPGKVVVRAEATGRPATRPGARTQAAEPVPLNLRCKGPMQVDFPRPHLPVKVGPPAPPHPTLVHFEREVVVRRGKLSELPDQLDCDNLDLVLVQAERPPPPEARKKAETPAGGDQPVVAAGPAQPTRPPEASDGMMGDHRLQRVKATGHAVWLQLPAEGAKIRCNELLHKVGEPGGENLTYFRGDATRKLMVEKHDYVEERPAKDGAPAKRKLQSITHVWAMDATLVDSGAGMESSNLFAHGPGLLETRPAPGPNDRPGQDIPPDRTVVWQDRLVVKNVLGPQKQLVGRELILKGSPRVVDRLQKASLDAADTIVVWLKPKPEDADTAKGATSPRSAGGGYEIERMLALRDVHLEAPSKKLTARERLDVDFEQAPRPVVTASNGAPAAAAQPSASPAAAAADPARPDGQPDAKPAEPEPAMAALANQVKARVLIDAGRKDVKAANGAGAQAASPGKVPGGDDSNYQIRDLLMFGAVSLHQDPAPGKTKGHDANGEAIVLRNEGPGRAVFNLYNHDPRVPKEAEAAGTRPRAKVVTEDMTVEGHVIGVNQLTDQAWVYGPGKLVQLTERSLLTDRAEGAAEDAAPKKRTRAGKVQSDRVPLVVTWGDKMLFSGRSQDPQNRPAAKAQFFKNARAEMEDGLLYCDDVMTTYTDQPIPLAEVGKLRQGAKAEHAQIEGEEPEKPKPDLALIDLVGNAQAISRKVDPDRPVLINRQRITGDRLLYDRRTGDFQIPGAGVVYLYDRNGNGTPGINQGDLAGGRTIRPTSGRVGERPGGKDPKKIPDLVLTQIRFSREMKGRFGTGKANDRTETRWADFFGDIEAARAVVPNERTIIDYDRLPTNSYFLTSQTMRVVTEPPPPGSASSTPARNFLKAWENAYARTDDTAIQADTITYDSAKDLIYANGQEGRFVQIVQQKGVGQPSSPTRAQSLRVNPRTGAVDLSDPRELQIVEAKTGTRPRPQAPPDPNAKPKKRPRPPYRPPLNNIERKGFTGR